MRSTDYQVFTVYSSQPVAGQRCLRFRLTFESALQVAALEVHFQDVHSSRFRSFRRPLRRLVFIPASWPLANLPIKLRVQHRPRVGRHIEIDGKNLFFRICPSVACRQTFGQA